MITNVPNPDLFESLFKIRFKEFIDVYHYSLAKEERHDSYHSSELEYRNESINRILKVINQPYYTNPGFAIFVTNTELQEQLLIYHLPWENEDGNCDFVKIAHELIFSDENKIAIIKGDKWQKGRSLVRIESTVFTKIEVKGQPTRYLKDGEETPPF